MKNLTALTEGALFVGTYLVMLLITLLVPLVEVFTLFLLPIPFLIYTSRNGLKQALIMFVAVIIVASLLTSIFTIPLVLLTGIGGLTIGFALYQKKSPYEVWAKGSLAFALGFVLLFLITQWFFQINWTEEMNTLIETSVSNTEQIIGDIGGTSEDTITQLEEQMKQIPYLIPTILGIVGVIYSFITIWIGFKILNRIDNQSYAFPPFREFQIPVPVFWYYMIALVLMWIYPESGNYINQAAVNVYIFTGMFLALHGLSFIFYYVHYKKWSKTVPIITIVGVVLFPLLVLYPIRILGIIDIAFNLRKRLSEKDSA
ncbi:YybS family protein [Salirhabdus salicampi]|uniref:YybS family protein n=1 Tax=Salirhabdus salicampi TaxID=476102 RepID=UPI0020C3DD42|nr:YybS family protein [Salirhabdus salicampi]MCP8617225.1 YybS family protein [Salirhabdus salicampi]